ncbi:purine-nucleoside phosphorylase [Dongia sp.]|uniref:purine-nucleoside phosphorylase n=1 Tax=Dongia sp. TaxID=1977262 RepID=UPI0035AD8AF4
MSAAAVKVVKRKAKGFRAEVGMILGSGMGGFADQIHDAVAIPYKDLPGFEVSGVAGHAGRLVLGYVGETPVAVLQGRIHYYEHGNPTGMRVPIETLRLLGCERLIVTNAAGSLKPAVKPGGLMLIRDHVNFIQQSPLLGLSGNGRFVDMVDAYDPEMRAHLRKVAAKMKIKLEEGVYAWLAGPQFETPAEIGMLRKMGIDAVGMSTVPDVILARYFGMKALAVSAITNMGAGMSHESLSHEHTMAQMETASRKLTQLLLAYLVQL